MTDQLALFGVLGDSLARDAISAELDATLFVEAGAGTGKTKALVDRVVALVTSDGVDLPRDRVERDHRRLRQHDPASTDVDQRVRGAEIDCDVAARRGQPCGEGAHYWSRT